MTIFYVAMSTLIYVKFCRQKFQNAYILSYRTNKKKVTSGNTSEEGKH